MREMDIATLVGIGIISAVLCVIVRQYKPEMALGVSVACGIILLTGVVFMLLPSIEAIKNLSETAGLSGDFSAILLKALAICYITQLACDCCKDAGESAIASKIELGGKAALAAVSLPVFTELARMVTGLLNGV